MVKLCFGCERCGIEGRPVNHAIYPPSEKLLTNALSHYYDGFDIWQLSTYVKTQFNLKGTSLCKERGFKNPNITLTATVDASASHGDEASRTEIQFAVTTLKNYYFKVSLKKLAAVILIQTAQVRLDYAIISYPIQGL